MDETHHKRDATICIWIGVSMALVASFVPIPGYWSILAMILWAGAILIFGAGLWCASEWAMDINADLETTRARIACMTPESVQLELETKLTPEQIRYKMSQRGLILDAEGEEPSLIVRLLFGEVPQDAISAIVGDYKDRDYLRPIRYYGQDEVWRDGGSMREYTKIISKHCIEKKYATGMDNAPKKWARNGREMFLYECGLGVKQIR